jgi:hypothetical protein
MRAIVLNVVPEHQDGTDTCTSINGHASVPIAKIGNLAGIHFGNFVAILLAEHVPIVSLIPSMPSLCPWELQTPWQIEKSGKLVQCLLDLLIKVHSIYHDFARDGVELKPHDCIGRP